MNIDLAIQQGLNELARREDAARREAEKQAAELEAAWAEFYRKVEALLPVEQREYILRPYCACANVPENWVTYNAILCFQVEGETVEVFTRVNFIKGAQEAVYWTDEEKGLYYCSSLNVADDRLDVVLAKAYLKFTDKRADIALAEMM